MKNGSTFSRGPRRKSKCQTHSWRRGCEALHSVNNRSHYQRTQRATPGYMKRSGRSTPPLSVGRSRPSIIIHQPTFGPFEFLRGAAGRRCTQFLSDSPVPRPRRRRPRRLYLLPTTTPLPRLQPELILRIYLTSGTRGEVCYYFSSAAPWNTNEAYVRLPANIVGRLASRRFNGKQNGDSGDIGANFSTSDSAN